MFHFHQIVEAFWRSQGIPITIFFCFVLFFDFFDGVGAGESFPVPQNDSDSVHLPLVKSGCLGNREKSLWGPTKRFSVIISVSDSRIEKCSADR